MSQDRIVPKLLRKAAGTRVPRSRRPGLDFKDSLAWASSGGQAGAQGSRWGGNAACKPGCCPGPAVVEEHRKWLWLLLSGAGFLPLGRTLWPTKPQREEGSPLPVGLRQGSDDTLESDRGDTSLGLAKL